VVRVGFPATAAPEPASATPPATGRDQVPT
jgi:hypothetical protein